MHKFIKRTVGAAMVSVGALSAICTLIFQKAFGRESLTAPPKKRRPPSPEEVRYKALVQSACKKLAQKPCEEVYITSDDGLRLCGKIYTPSISNKNEEHCQTDGTPPTIILAVHGYHSDGPRDFAIFTPYFERQGYVLCLVDDRAHGKSEGKYIGFAHHDRFDCLLWCQYLAKRYGENCRIFLHGISMGAATVLSCSDSSKLPSQVRGIIADCGYSNGWDEVAHVLKNRMHLPTFPLLPIYNRVCRILGGYDLRDIRPIDHAAASRVPILFIHGDKDTFVPTAMVYKLYHACKNEKRLLIVPGAVHAVSYMTDKKSYEAAMTNFINK